MEIREITLSLSLCHPWYWLKGHRTLQLCISNAHNICIHRQYHVVLFYTEIFQLSSAKVELVPFYDRVEKLSMKDSKQRL